MILVSLRLLPSPLRQFLFRLDLKLVSRVIKISFFLLFLFLNKTYAQDQWVDFVVKRENSIMTVTLDLQYFSEKPNFKNLVIVGTKFQNCMKNGFPKPEGLDEIFPFSDSTSAAINRITKNKLVSILTYKCLAFDVYFVKDTLNLRKEIAKTFEDNFSQSKNYLSIKRDRNWGYYHDFLLPKGLSEDYLVDQKYLYDLVLQGDDLEGLRKVRHWVYFSKLKQRTKMADRLTKMKFSMDSINYIRESAVPYELQFSRMDSIDPNSISDLTTLLKIVSASFQGQYDGWGTELILKD